MNRVHLSLLSMFIILFIMWSMLPEKCSLVTPFTLSIMSSNASWLHRIFHGGMSLKCWHLNFGSVCLIKIAICLPNTGLKFLGSGWCKIKPSGKVHIAHISWQCEYIIWFVVLEWPLLEYISTHKKYFYIPYSFILKVEICTLEVNKCSQFF